jgi:hypothetical protein
LRIKVFANKFYLESLPAATIHSHWICLVDIHITDEPLVAQMKSIGIEPGKSFDFENLDPATQMALEKGRSRWPRDDK